MHCKVCGSELIDHGEKYGLKAGRYHCNTCGVCGAEPADGSVKIAEPAQAEERAEVVEAEQEKETEPADGYEAPEDTTTPERRVRRR